ncbi:MAG: hypothetical protein HYY91_01120 [Candidatus Omnitrophica bacterium]|nr:hypothetical protein [Candidatus Omnitrophota bacterium]
MTQNSGGVLTACRPAKLDGTIEDVSGRFLPAWEVLIADEPTASAQMRLDEALARRGRPTFRLFRWAQPAVSLGFRQASPAWVNPYRLAGCGVEVIERPTGGGLAVHGSDLSCSVVVPHDPGHSLRDVMRLVCGSLTQGLRTFGVDAQWQEDGEAQARIEYCLTESSPYAVMAGGRKWGGLAIRRYPSSWLIQGSMLLRPLPEVFDAVMPPDVLEAFRTRAVSLEALVGRSVADEELIEELTRAWHAV